MGLHLQKSISTSLRMKTLQLTKSISIPKSSCSSNSFGKIWWDLVNHRPLSLSLWVLNLVRSQLDLARSLPNSSRDLNHHLTATPWSVSIKTDHHPPEPKPTLLVVSGNWQQITSFATRSGQVSSRLSTTWPRLIHGQP